VASTRDPSEGVYLVLTAPNLALLSRKFCLGSHGNQSSKSTSPFISLRSNPKVIAEDHARRAKEKQKVKRFNCFDWVTLFNPVARLDRGLPILSIKGEHKHYKVTTLYHGNNPWYDWEYLCPFSINTDRIIMSQGSGKVGS
jgi:hypothetical protein